MTKPGPKSRAAKAAVRGNATRHGILSDAPIVRGVEDPADWDRHLAGMVESLQPEGHYESVLVERIANILWRIKRVMRYDAEVTTAYVQDAEEDLAAAADLGERINIPREQTMAPEKLTAQQERRMIPGELTLTTIMKYESHLHRLYTQTAHELEAVQTRRQGGQSPLARFDFSAPPA